MVTTGRTLDGAGHPIDGTGFELSLDSDLAERLAQRTGPLTSHPTQGVWSTSFPGPDEDDETIRALGIYTPGFEGPPEHYHEHSTERFAVEAGAVTFQVDDHERRIGAGETITVEPGDRHTFTVGGSDLCYMIVDIESPGRLRAVLPTLSGLAHDARRNPDNPLQQAAIARRLTGNTVFTELPPTLARPLNAVLAPLARLRGYQGAYGTYMQDAFWERHVEQPAWSTEP